MKVDGITLLQMIKDGEIEKNTKIKVWMKTQFLKNLVTTLNYDGINLNWNSGTFYASFFWDKNYGFEITEEEEKPIKEVKEIRELIEASFSKLEEAQDKINRLENELEKRGNK